MSIQKEYEGKTVTDATIEACKDLGINREDLNFEVISEGTTGLLGIGGRNAVIKILNQDLQFFTKDILLILFLAGT